MFAEYSSALYAAILYRPPSLWPSSSRDSLTFMEGKLSLLRNTSLANQRSVLWSLNQSQVTWSR